MREMRTERTTVKIVSFALLCTFALLAGCASRSPDLGTYYDPVTGRRTDMITDNLLDSGDQSREMVWLNASRVSRRNTGEFDLYLEVSYAATPETGHLDIGPGQTLTIVTDGKERKFSGVGSQNLRSTKSGALYEHAIYPATADDLVAIARAQNVTVRIEGARGLLVRQFTPENTERFKKFVNSYIVDVDDLR